MKIFGIGLNKTGTQALGACLRYWGLRHTSYDRQAFELWRRGELEELFQLAENYDSFEDWPWALMYRELDQHFPDSKFILTRRESPQTWFQSLCHHAERGGPTVFRKQIYGFDLPHHYPREHIEIYEKHNADVRAYFRDRPDKLHEVCWEEGDGWNELATFLNFMPPDRPLPQRNRSRGNPSPSGDLVSVVVPFYGVEAYFAECLESLAKQTYSNIEILCIDDCSPDNSLAIAREFEARDPRVRIIQHDENKGLGGARNTGIEQARGNYICFVDSDDCVSDRFVELLYDAITENNSDISACGFFGFSNHNWDVAFTTQYEDTQFNNEDHKSNVFDLADHIRGASWLKMYRHDLLLRHNLCQPEKRYYEGVVFWLKAVYYSSKITTIRDVLYFYRQRPGSIMTTMSEQHVDDRLDFVEQIQHFFHSEILRTPHIDTEKATDDYVDFILKHLRYGYRLFEEACIDRSDPIWACYDQKVQKFTAECKQPRLQARLSALTRD